VCPSLLTELERVLLRPKFRPYVTVAEARAFVALLGRLAEVHPNPAVQPGLTPDPGDDYLVALARAVRVHFLVSGDQHLLKLKVPQPPVLTPRAFLECIEQP
jgi:putative PIN family toxin of toxin-antitoxin system